MEEAEETATDLLTSTWDQVHAFNCLGRNASRISLYRLGVPHECLTGLIGIDETGKTVIRTPMKQSYLMKKIKIHNLNLLFLIISKSSTLATLIKFSTLKMTK